MNAGPGARPERPPSRPPPLSGVRVLDLSRLLPGPLCGQHLADLGAHVIKIEDPRVGDYVRPSLRALVNRGKEGVTINLKDERGRRIFLELLSEADVVIESFRPGVMERLGLAYETLAAHRPCLVHCAITGYGQTGPRRDAAGHDINFLAISGVLDQTGSSDGPPVLPGFLVSDILGGTLTAAMGILAALVESRTTSRGRFIDVSMADAVMVHSVLPLAEANEHGGVQRRGHGSHTGGMLRYNVYSARDGRFLAIGAQERKFWDAFCDRIGLPELKSRHSARVGGAPDLEGELRRIIASRDAAEWMELLGPLDCCVTEVLSFEEALADPAFLTRGTVRCAPSGAGHVMGFPFRMSDFDCPASAAAPTKGEHTTSVLSRLGYEPEEIEELRKRGVI